MTDSYSWQSDSRPRPEVGIDVRRGEDEVSCSQEEPTAEQVSDFLAAFERLAGLLLARGGAS